MMITTNFRLDSYHHRQLSLVHASNMCIKPLMKKFFFSGFNFNKKNFMKYEKSRKEQKKDKNKRDILSVEKCKYEEMERKMDILSGGLESPHLCYLGCTCFCLVHLQEDANDPRDRAHGRV